MIRDGKHVILIFICCTILIFTSGCNGLLMQLLSPDAERSDAGSSDNQKEQNLPDEQTSNPPKQDTALPPASDDKTPDGISFDHAGWPMIEQNVFGGSIQVGVPVTGVISEEKNFHRFSLYIPEQQSETFGLILILTANTDEYFEIFFAEYYNNEPLIMSWNSFYEQSEHVVIDGRRMTITYPGVEYYGGGAFTWEFNCPEYQWGDGPEDPNPSNLKLHFTFLLDPES